MADDTQTAPSFYRVRYNELADDLTPVLRREVFPEDFGQVGWRSPADQAEFAECLRVGRDSTVLDIACGGGGPSLDLARRTGCRLTGVDLEPSGIAHAQAQAAAGGLAGKISFLALDCDGPLPFADGAFDGVLCIDAILHLRDRFAVLAEWARLLRRGGRLVFTDPAVLTGGASMEELATRTQNGYCLIVPPGLNERAIAAAGLRLILCEDRSHSAAEIAGRWVAARDRHRARVERREGADGFARRQQFFEAVRDLAATRRLSRLIYVAEKG